MKTGLETAEKGISVVLQKTKAMRCMEPSCAGEKHFTWKNDWHKIQIQYMEKSHHEYAAHASMEKDVTKMMMNMQGFLYWGKDMERSLPSSNQSKNEMVKFHCGNSMDNLPLHQSFNSLKSYPLPHIIT